MSNTTLVRPTSVAPVRRRADAHLPSSVVSLQARARQVLQSGRAPAQLSLFLRPSAIDVK
jgi:hypothetical protein